jgi:hypothetical protein
MAANAGAIRAGKAFVEFVVSDKKIAGQLRSLQKRFTAIGSGLQRVGAIGTAVGGTITAAFGGAVSLFADAGSRIDDIANRTGIGITALQELGFAAEQSGASLEDIQKAAINMKKKGLNPADFNKVADEIAAIEDPVKRSQKAYETFGKAAGAALEPMLADLAQLRQQHRDLNLGIAPDDVKAAAALGDAFDVLKGQLKAIVIQVGAAVAGPLSSFLEMTKPILATVIEWIKNNRPLIQTIAGIGLAVTAVGGVLITAGLGFSLLGVAAGGLAAAVTAVGTVIGAILSPIGLVVAAVAGGVTAFAMFTDSGKGMVASLVSSFGWLKDTVLTSLKAVGAALSAGDIALAGKVLWATLKLLWLQGTQSLRETWHSLTGGIVKVWHLTWAGLQQLANAAIGNLERGWSHTTEFLTTVWETAIGNVKKAWNSTVAFMEKTWLRIKGLFGADVQGEIDRINGELESANSEIDRRTAQSAADRNAAGAAGREQSRQRQAVVLDQIGAELAAKLSGADEGTKQRIAAAQQQLEDARAAWKEATAAATAAGEAAAAQRAAAKEAGNDLAKAAFDASGKSSLGTFSADAVAALQGGSSAEEETAKNTKETAKRVGELSTALTGNFLRFVVR